MLAPSTPVGLWLLGEAERFYAGFRLDYVPSDALRSLHRLLLLISIISMVIWAPWIGDAWDKHNRLVQAVFCTTFNFAVFINVLWGRRHRGTFWTSVAVVSVLHVMGVFFYSTRVHPTSSMAVASHRHCGNLHHLPSDGQAEFHPATCPGVVADLWSNRIGDRDRNFTMPLRPGKPVRSAWRGRWFAQASALLPAGSLHAVRGRSPSILRRCEAPQRPPSVRGRAQMQVWA
jgi:hypothetical protein